MAQSPGSAIRMCTRTEVTTGVFDTRTYKVSKLFKVFVINFLHFQLNDPNWAKKRKSSWMAWPGTIKFTRERTVDREEDENDNEKEAEKNEPDRKERGRKGAIEIKINVQRKKVHCSQSEDVWPRRKRTDITEL